jgi:hypothetical protein
MVYAEWVKLLIEDMRKTSAHGHSKISQDVFLEVSERGEHGEWKTELHEVLYELQKSNAAIEGTGSFDPNMYRLMTPSLGPTKVLYRDPEDPEYWVVFVKVTDNAPVPLELAETFPRFVTIPATGRLELRVEPVSLSDDPTLCVSLNHFIGGRHPSEYCSPTFPGAFRC